MDRRATAPEPDDQEAARAACPASHL